MMNDNIVVLRKKEYETLTNDSLLANLTRRFLTDVEDNYACIEKLRFIYNIPTLMEREDT